MAKRYPNLDSPVKLSDIELLPQYDIICNDHGVVTQTRTYKAAVEVRRKHWLEHPDHRDAALARGDLKE